MKTDCHKSLKTYLMLIAQKKRITILQQLTNHDTLRKITQPVTVLLTQDIHGIVVKGLNKKQLKCKV